MKTNASHGSHDTPLYSVLYTIMHDGILCLYVYTKLFFAFVYGNFFSRRGFIRDMEINDENDFSSSHISSTHACVVICTYILVAVFVCVYVCLMCVCKIYMQIFELNVEGALLYIHTGNSV